MSPPIERRHEEAVRRERAAHLDQRPGEIVDGLQRQQRHGEVEPALRRRQPLDVPDRAEEPAGAEARQGGRDPDDSIDLAARREAGGGIGSGRAEIGGEGEPALDQGQALAEFVRCPGEQEIRAAAGLSPRPGAIEPRIDERAIEDLRRRRRGRHARALMRRLGARRNLEEGKRRSVPVIVLSPRATPCFALTSVA